MVPKGYCARSVCYDRPGRGTANALAALWATRLSLTTAAAFSQPQLSPTPRHPFLLIVAVDPERLAMMLNPRHADTVLLNALAVGLEDAEDGMRLLFSCFYVRRIL
jgi:hypothetical protein